MKSALLGVTLLLAVMPVSAHRLDEYLQGSIVSIEKDRALVQMTLTPGVAILPYLLPYIDADQSGDVSRNEQRNYAERVVNDLSFQVDGRKVGARLASMCFPSMSEITAGRGEVQLELVIDLPRGGRERNIRLENHHLNQISAYQVNALVPQDRALRITSQDLNYTQSVYQLNYSDASASPDPWFSVTRWIWVMVALFAARVLFLFGRQWYDSRSPHVV